MPDARALVSAFLAHHADPEGGAALHALLAPEAPWPFGQAVATAGAIDPAAFALRHRDLAGHAGMPTFSLGPVLAEADGVLWAQVEEARSGAVLALAAGHAEGRLGWVTLAEQAEPWDPAMGLAQTLADWPYQGAAEARSWLDLAFRRLAGFPRPPLQVLPEARFSCHGDSACCRVDYLVEVDPAFQRVIDAIPWQKTRPDLAGTQLPMGANGQLQVKQDGKACRFLDDQNRCAVYAAMGRAIFPPCARFPFSFVATPEGVAVSASSLCPSVRGGLGMPLADREVDLYRRMAIAPESIFTPRGYRLMEGREVSWETYKEAETAVLSYLARTELPLLRRLWLGTALLANWEQGFRAVPAELEAMAIPVATAAERQAMQILLADFLRFFGLATVPAIHQGQPLHGEGVLTGMLRQMVFSKILSASFDLATAQNLGLLLVLLVMHLEVAEGGALRESQWQALGRLFMHGGILQALASAGANDYREMFASPEFGLWLATYPLEAPCAVG